VERFTEPSRRCDPALVAEADDEVVVWDLARPPSSAWRLAVDLLRAAPGWATTGAPPRRVWKYLRACVATSGWRRGALMRMPELIRRARRREVDAIACFSRDGFALVELLAEDAEVGCVEQLSRGTQYFGEFAFELLAVVPYAYWLHQQGRLQFTVSTEDTRALYYFSPHHVEHDAPRRYVPITEYPAGVAGAQRYDALALPASLSTAQWEPPPYREIYADDRFSWSKPPVIVSNKTSGERYRRSGSGGNSIPVDVLLELIGRLSEKYTVVYNRPRETDIIGDHDEVREPGDIEAVERAFPDVLTIQQLHTEHRDLTFNELQLHLYARCERFVSVLGGGSYLASYFGGTNIVYARSGWEVDCGAYERWFHRFSGADIIAVHSPDELLRVADARFLRHD
jgi:hypothetical protein